MMSISTNITPKKPKHPQQTPSEVTIFDFNSSNVPIEDQDIDMLIKKRYGEQQRKFLIINRARGTFIDSRVVDVEKQVQASLRQSYYRPSLKAQLEYQQYPQARHPPHKKQQIAYQPVTDVQVDTEQPMRKDRAGGRLSKEFSMSVWDSTWKQYDKVQEQFLYSIIRNEPQKFILLLDKKTAVFPVDVNYRYQNNWAAIHYAAMQPCPDFMGKILNQPQTDANILTDFNETALHIAARSNNLENCLMLIECKVELDRADKDRNTALHYASELGYLQIVKALLESRASCEIRNAMGLTAIDAAVPHISYIFQPYRTDHREDRLYSNRLNHRAIVQKFLQARSSEQTVIPNCRQRKKRITTQQWRNKRILKLYNLIRQFQPSNKVTLSDFEFYRKIGEGAYGQVYIVKRVGFDDDRLYALKAIKKERVDGTNLKRYIQTQREILSLVDHPFIVKLRFAFQTKEHLFLLMDYCEGGDLSRFLQKRKRFNEDEVKNYACEILLALQALHKNNIIYRDLKPENIVIDKEGHVLVTDFGLSKRIESSEQMNQSFCGTPAYIPIQIINKKGHNRMVDWYEFGIVLYELYMGTPPFFAENKSLLYQTIKKGVVKFNKNTPPPLLKDLIIRLLDQDPQKRLGFEKDAESIRQHPWFKDVNWNDVLERRLEMPKVESNIDLGDPILSKFVDLQGGKFIMPHWSFAE